MGTLPVLQTLKEAIEFVQDFQDRIDILQYTHPEKAKTGVVTSFRRKSVFIDKDINKVIKIYPRCYGEILYQFVLDTNRHGIDFFLPMNKEYETFNFLIVSQEILSPLREPDDLLIYLSSLEKRELLFSIINFFDMRDIKAANCGKNSNGQIQCYDFDLIASFEKIKNSKKDINLILKELLNKTPLLKTKIQRTDKKVMIEEFKNYLNSLQTSANELSQLKSLNNLPVDISWRNKLVVEGDDGFIYKTDDYISTIKRLLVNRYFISIGLNNIFLEEKIVKDMSSSYFITTKQVKVEPSLDSEKDIYDLILNQCKTEELKNLCTILFKELNIIGYSKSNSGFLADGTIRIFDWIDNLALTQRESDFILIDATGKEIFRDRFSI